MRKGFGVWVALGLTVGWTACSIEQHPDWEAPEPDAATTGGEGSGGAETEATATESADAGTAGDGDGTGGDGDGTEEAMRFSVTTPVSLLAIPVAPDESWRSTMASQAPHDQDPVFGGTAFSSPTNIDALSYFDGRRMFSVSDTTVFEGLTIHPWEVIEYDAAGPAVGPLVDTLEFATGAPDPVNVDALHVAGPNAVYISFQAPVTVGTTMYGPDTVFELDPAAPASTVTFFLDAVAIGAGIGGPNVDALHVGSSFVALSISGWWDFPFGQASPADVLTWDGDFVQPLIPGSTFVPQPMVFDLNALSLSGFP